MISWFVSGVARNAIREASMAEIGIPIIGVMTF
jgi:hypothetical protein